MSENQPYEVIRRYDDFEVRKYPQHLVAEITLQGKFESAGNRAFRFLFAYIGGENQPRQQPTMSPSVEQHNYGATIRMTAPVLQQNASEGTTDPKGVNTFRVAFVLPAGFTAETAPQPTNPDVFLRTIPESMVAAIRYRGRWSESSYQRHLDQLRLALAGAGLDAVGSPRFARFDPPVLPPLLRRNEVLLEVVAPN